MPAMMGTPVTSANPNVNTNTSLAVTLGTTTPGQLNVIELSGYATGTNINPVVATPAGWTKLLEQVDPGTPQSQVAIYWRKFVAGDPSSVTFTWTNPGQMVAICTPWSGQHATAPIPYSNSSPKSGSNTSYSIAGTTGASAGMLCYGFANRTGAAWSALTDTARGQIGLSSSSTMVGRCTGTEVAAGTAYTKTATGSNTSVGVQWAYTLAAAPASSFTGTANLSGSGTLTASGTPAQGGAAGLSGSGTLTAKTMTAVDRWIASTPMYVAHRGGSSDYVECTAEAYAAAIAYGVTALEVPVWATADGHWVVSHDRTTGRVFGTNLDIPSVNWSALSGLTTLTGGYSIIRLQDVLDLYATSAIIFVENKRDVNNSVFLDFLETYPEAHERFVVKGYAPSAVGSLALARGFQSWGYYYDDATLTNAPTTAGSWSLLGMDYAASQAAWDSLASYGKPVLGHVCTTAGHVSTAFSKGAAGVMTGKVVGVIPQTGFTGAAGLSGVGALTQAATPQVPGSGSLSGSGALTAAGLAVYIGTASFSGSGALTASGAPSPTGAAGLTGSGTLTASGTPAQNGSAALSGAGTLGGTGTPKPNSQAALGGSGALSGAFTPGPSETGALAGSGVLSGSGTVLGGNAFTGTADLAGQGALTGTGTPAPTVAAGFSGTGSLTAAGNPSVGLSAGLNGEGAVTAQGWPRITDTAALGGSGGLSATSVATLIDMAEIQGFGTLEAIGIGHEIGDGPFNPVEIGTGVIPGHDGTSGASDSEMTSGSVPASTIEGIFCATGP